MQYCVSPKVMLLVCDTFVRTFEEVGVCVQKTFPGKSQDLSERLEMNFRSFIILGEVSVLRFNCFGVKWIFFFFFYVIDPK